MKESFGLNIAVLKQCSIHAERLLHCTTCDRSPLKEMSGVELLKVNSFPKLRTKNEPIVSEREPLIV